MTAQHGPIPPTTLNWLDRLPRDRPVAMLLRHAARGPLAESDPGARLPLTADGQRCALALGRQLGHRLRAAHASPFLRTMQTAARLLEGAGRPQAVLPDTLLGDPGVYMLDQRAGPLWGDLGHEAMLNRLVEDLPPLPGCAAADPAARFLVHHMLAASRGEPGITAFSTHDSVVTVTAARMLQTPLRRVDWPQFLEAAFFWEEAGAVQVAYRDRRGARAAPLVGPTDDDGVHFARREVAATLGLDCPARFFLAGGAFKTLLTGQPARTLDLWAPSERDRTLVHARLLGRGARPLPPLAQGEGFRLGGRDVTLHFRTQPDGLEALLASFEPGILAMGAEHCPLDQWRAAVPVEGRQTTRLEDPAKEQR